MESSESSSPRRRSLWWVALAMLLLLVAGGVVGISVWMQQPRPDGSRVRWGWGMSGSAAAAAGRGMPLELSAELIADGVKAQDSGIQEEAEGVLFVIRERVALRVRVTAGKDPVAPGRLTYVLRDAGGKALSEGRFQDAPVIQPGAEAFTQIADINLREAARIEIGKAP